MKKRKKRSSRRRYGCAARHTFSVFISGGFLSLTIVSTFGTVEWPVTATRALHWRAKFSIGREASNWCCLIGRVLLSLIYNRSFPFASPASKYLFGLMHQLHSGALSLYYQQRCWSSFVWIAVLYPYWFECSVFLFFFLLIEMKKEHILAISCASLSHASVADIYVCTRDLSSALIYE